MSSLSSNLKLLKVKKPYKQKEIADFVGVTVSTWSNYEVGRSEPKLEDLVKISDFFGITVDTLLKDGNPSDENIFGLKPSNGNEKGNLKGNLIDKLEEETSKMMVQEPGPIYQYAGDSKALVLVPIKSLEGIYSRINQIEAKLKQLENNAVKGK